jgi:hypothetical protein
MARVRPYQNLDSPQLLKAVFDAAFDSDAKRFEELIYELQGGDIDHAGRSKLKNISSVLVEVAHRVFDSQS